MVDDFMVCVDRLIASACYEREILHSSGGAGGSTGGVSVTDQKKKQKKTSGGVVECRICQEEDEEHEMEAPCACNGTLKFAHRRCIQKWCNKKGDITCEICNQVYSPNYIPPPEKSYPDVMPIAIRHAYIDSQFVALTVAEREFLQSEYDDSAFANNGSLACFRPVAIILMVILLIHQALMVSRDFGMVQESSTFFNFQISLLQLAGFLLPCYVMARSIYFILCRRRRQG